MKRFVKAAVLTLTIALTGCAATVQRQDANSAPLASTNAAGKKLSLYVTGSQVSTTSADWEKLRGEWRSAMTGAAAAAGIPFTYYSTDPQPQSDSGTLVVVQVNDYRYLSAMTRFLLGVMAGNAFIDAEVSYYELPDRKLLGSKKYNTSSSASQGIFSAMTSKQLEALSADIVKEVSR